MAEPNYIITATRKARFTELTELVKPVEALVRAIEREGPRFKLFGYSPAYDVHPLNDGELSNADKFVMTCDIQWNFGREPGDPTYDFVFFNDANDRSVMLKMEFVLEGDEGTFPGLRAEIFVRADVLGETTERDARLERLRAALVETLDADEAGIRKEDPKS